MTQQNKGEEEKEQNEQKTCQQAAKKPRNAKSQRYPQLPLQEGRGAKKIGK